MHRSLSLCFSAKGPAHGKEDVQTHSPCRTGALLNAGEELEARAPGPIPATEGTLLGWQQTHQTTELVPNGIQG